MILTRGSESVTILFCMISENFQGNVLFQPASSININTNIRSISDSPVNPPQLMFSSYFFASQLQQKNFLCRWGRLLFSAGFGITCGRITSPAPHPVYHRELVYKGITWPERLSKEASGTKKAQASARNQHFSLKILMWEEIKEIFLTKRPCFTNYKTHELSEMQKSSTHTHTPLKCGRHLPGVPTSSLFLSLFLCSSSLF